MVPIASSPLESLTRLRRVIARIESMLSGHTSPTTGLLRQYQSLWRDFEQTRLSAGLARRPVVVVIPVAERPAQLAAALESLLSLLNHYHYGGCRNGIWQAVSVLVVEDSCDPVAAASQRALSQSISQAGLITHYWDTNEQQRFVTTLNQQQRIEAGIESAYSDPPHDNFRFCHKGASVSRNLATIWLSTREKAEGNGWRLIHYIDSDQLYRLNLTMGDREIEDYLVNHYALLDELFSSSDAPLVATGKVVGDPPVSPAVMAETLLNDLLQTIEKLICSPPCTPCTLSHNHSVSKDADYHDMADLFGFKPTKNRGAIHCRLSQPHSCSDALSALCHRLDAFFDGEHPTRSSSFHRTPDQQPQPARTIYTGNYIQRSDHPLIIPFANLRLRMAGPTMGRILRARLGGRFLAINLPLLHRRTESESMRSGYRPGVEHHTGRTDLSDEFRRQYLGDLMLFSIEKLTINGLPKKVDKIDINKVVDKLDGELLDRYKKQQTSIAAATDKLAKLIVRLAREWPHDKNSEVVQRFITNLQANFGPKSPTVSLLCDQSEIRARKINISHAIYIYFQQTGTIR